MIPAAWTIGGARKMLTTDRQLDDLSSQMDVIHMPPKNDLQFSPDSGRGHV